MALQRIATHRDLAEIYHGTTLCKQKSWELFRNFRLPSGLLPMNDLVEVGYNQTTGFVWLKQSKSMEHRFKAIRKTVSYETEVTAFVDDGRMRRLTGVKSKELLIWVTISDIFVEESNPNKITFASPRGLSRSFPLAVFEAVGEERK